MAKFERLTISISPETKENLARLSEHYGITNISSLIAMAIRAEIRNIDKQEK